MSKNLNLARILPILYITIAIIGLLVAFELTYDKIQTIKNPAYVPVCNINPILSCGDIMKTKQSDLLGVPNPIFGLVGFGMLLAFGLALAAGASFKRWLWLVINGGALIGFVYFVYLFFEAVFRIHAICPFCFVIWMIIPPILWYTTLYNLKQKHLRLKWLKPKAKDWLIKHHGDIMFSWYLIVFLILLIKFWYYWKTLL